MYFQCIFPCKYNQWIIRFYCVPGKTPALNHFWSHIRSLNGRKHPVPFTPGLMFPKFWLRLKLSILCCIQKLKMCFYSGYDFTSVENKYITVSRIWCFLQRQRTNPSSTCYRTAFSVPSQEAQMYFEDLQDNLLAFYFCSSFFTDQTFSSAFFFKKRKCSASLRSNRAFPPLKFRHICHFNKEKQYTQNFTYRYFKVDIYVQNYDPPLLILRLICSEILPTRFFQFKVSILYF